MVSVMAGSSGLKCGPWLTEMISEGLQYRGRFRDKMQMLLPSHTGVICTHGAKAVGSKHECMQQQTRYVLTAPHKNVLMP